MGAGSPRKTKLTADSIGFSGFHRRWGRRDWRVPELRSRGSTGSWGEKRQKAGLALRWGGPSARITRPSWQGADGTDTNCWPGQSGRKDGAIQGGGNRSRCKGAHPNFPFDPIYREACVVWGKKSNWAPCTMSSISVRLRRPLFRFPGVEGAAPQARQGPVGFGQRKNYVQCEKTTRKGNKWLRQPVQGGPVLRAACGEKIKKKKT